MSENTTWRIISAFALLFLLIFVAWLGKYYVIGLLGIIAQIVFHEFYVNFLKKDFKKLEYYLLSLFHLFLYVLFSYFVHAILAKFMIIGLGVLLNFYLIYYLFKTEMEDVKLKNFLTRYPVIMSLYVLVMFLNISGLLRFESWKDVLATVIFVNFGMDTGAWFFGRRYGKTKLWEKVSPKKTVEGLIGGALSSGILGVLVWQFLMIDYSFGTFILMVLLGLVSHFGDLVQSKLKRQYNLKDSSNLIPGHGGFYDRLDSLIFASPFLWSAFLFWAFI